jgi:hypothetical protein
MHSNLPASAAARIGRSLDAVSGSWFVVALDGRVLGITMHVLASFASCYRLIRPTNLACGERRLVSSSAAMRK